MTRDELRLYDAERERKHAAEREHLDKGMRRAQLGAKWSTIVLVVTWIAVTLLELGDAL